MKALVAWLILMVSFSSFSILKMLPIEDAFILCLNCYIGIILFKIYGSLR